MDVMISFIASVFVVAISLLFFLIQNYNKNKKQKNYTTQENEMFDSEALEKNRVYICCKDIHLYTSLNSLIIQGKQYVSLKKDKTIFGREATLVDIAIQDITISKIHFMIFSESDLWYIEDCGSSNGTSVNGKKIQRLRLFPGDCIKAGRTEMLFCTTL